jgi:hypothetical protein
MTAMQRALSTFAFATFAVVVGTAGCGRPMHAESAMPNGGHDTSHLAKCSVAASREQPLVTEWPASYKARLEALLQGGAVAVEYSGCDLKIIDRCRLSGSYAWKKTTLSIDTTDIQDEDDLYAKLPLGAASLSGQLKTSGSLHVQTTVSGQLQLVGKSADDATSGAECSHATHLVTALSIGAFKLVAGGAAKVSGSAEYGGMSAGGSSAQTRSVLRAAGDAVSCERATKEEPSPECRSPIQIFLTPIRWSVPLNILSPLPDERG